MAELFTELLSYSEDPGSNLDKRESFSYVLGGNIMMSKNKAQIISKNGFMNSVGTH
jgi:hypothetical protein